MITFSCSPTAIPWEPTWLLGPAGRRMMRVTEDILVRDNGSYLCTIKAGFYSDRTSWPPLLEKLRWITTIRKWLKDRKGKYSLAALLHDYQLLTRPDLPKWVVDDNYHDALRSLSTSAIESFVFWLSVRTRRPGKPKKA